MDSMLIIDDVLSEPLTKEQEETLFHWYEKKLELSHGVMLCSGQAVVENSDGKQHDPR